MGSDPRGPQTLGGVEFPTVTLKAQLFCGKAQFILVGVASQSQRLLVEGRKRETIEAPSSSKV